MKIIKAPPTITDAGLYTGLDIETYHSPAMLPAGEYAVSSSDLRTAWSLSMAHAYDRWAHNPNRAEHETTRPMILGSAAHHLLLGEGGFNTKFIAKPEEYEDAKTGEFKKWNGNATVCKDWLEDQERHHRTVVTQKELESIVGMARSLALEPLVKDGILEGAVECSGFAKDKETGLWIKVRPDVIPTTGGDFVDLKTIADITDRGIKKSLRERGYHQQGALVWDWCDKVGLDFETFTLAFVETARPYCARMVPVADDDLARGAGQNRAMMRKFADCIDSGHWPGPGEGELAELWLPEEERHAIDQRLEAIQMEA